MKPLSSLLAVASALLVPGASVLPGQERARELVLPPAPPPRAEVVGTPIVEKGNSSLPWAPTAEDVSSLFDSYAPGTGGPLLPDLLAPPESRVNEGPAETRQLPEHLQRTGLAWHMNPYAARRTAALEGRFLLIMFGGWDWSERCSALAWEVFSSEEFGQLAERDLVLCVLDFPQKLSDAHDNLVRFKEFYRVKGLPYALLLDPSGDPFLRKGGYLPGKARSYFDMIDGAVLEEKEARLGRRQQLALRGYREWHGKHGHSLFGRLVEEGTEDLAGRAIILDEYGYRHAIDPLNLGDRDRKLLPHLLEVIGEGK